MEKERPDEMEVAKKENEEGKEKESHEINSEYYSAYILI